MAPPIALRIPGVAFKASLHPPSQTHPWPLTSKYPNLKPHRSEGLQEPRCEDPRQLGKSNPKPCAQTHKIRGVAREFTAFTTSEFNKPEGAGKLPMDPEVQFSKAVTCSPLTTLMGLVLSRPCRGEFTLLCLLIAHSKTNLLGSQTQGRGFQAPLGPKLSSPGSRHV